MKKKLIMLGVFFAVIFCTLAYATTGQGTLEFLDNSGVPVAENPQSTTVDQQKTAVGDKPQRGMQINKESILSASAHAVAPEAKKGAKGAPSVEPIKRADWQVEDLWSRAAEIYHVNDGTSFDAITNTISFPGSYNGVDQIFTGINEEGEYAWFTEADRTYVFSGTLTSDGDATILVCVVFYNGQGLINEGGMYCSLNSYNGYSTDFDVSPITCYEGYPLMVVFYVEDSSPETTIQSTNNQLYSFYDSESGSKNYTFTCEDGVTTLDLFYEDYMLYVTGIKTPASEFTLPTTVTVGEEVRQIDCFGYNGQMDWSGAPNLSSLDISSAYGMNASFYNSRIKDLFIDVNCQIYSTPSGVGNIYLHLPYCTTRAYFSDYGFKRVLVGDEQPSYPIAYNSNWVIAGENEGDYFGISTYNGNYVIREILTQGESVVLPVSTPTQYGLETLRYLGNDGQYSRVLCQNAPNLKTVTIPSTYTNLRVYWAYCPIVNFHMLGNVPATSYSLTEGMTVYVAEKSYFSQYENNSNWKRANIVPEGWEFEWMTIDVERKGEFAQTYIEMNDADWGLGTFVKVTGTLNSTDLQNIKNLTSLRKLDLREAIFTDLPNSFLESRSSLMEVYLSENVTSLPQNAFRYCSNLTLVSAPGITSVGTEAFNGCSKLFDFDLSKVTTIKGKAFYNCSLYNPVDISSLKSISSEAFYNTGIREVIIPEGISTINSSVFSNCSQLEKVSLPNTIKTINSQAFNQCGSLTLIGLPEGLTTINNSAFKNCPSLPEITFPSTLTSIGSDILDGCTSLRSVKCKAIMPPNSNGDFTERVDLNHCTLYVAPFTIDAYREAKDWSNFYIMKPLNESVKNIYINRPISFDLLSEDNAVLQDNPNMTLDYSSASQVGQLYAQGDGTLSAGIFTIRHQFGSRYSSGISDYRTTLVNDAENMRADSVLCSINFEKNRWHFISFQYDVQMEDIFGHNNTDFVIREYDSQNRASGDGTTSNWKDMHTDEILKAGNGYIIQAANNTTDENGYTYAAVVRFPSRNTVTKNNLFTSKNIIVPLEEYPSEFAHNRSWNFVGNPYPCYYDMHYLLNDFTTPIVLWRGSAYQAYSPVDDDIILRPNEAFFVQKPLDAEEMTFGVEGRMDYTTAYNNNGKTPGAFKAPAFSNHSEANRAVFNFNMEGCGSDDRARIVMNEDASMEYEINRDAPKFFSESAEGAEIYVDGNIKYDICERPLAEGIATLGTRIGTKGVYTISLSGRNIEDWTVTLTDTHTGATSNLSEGPYTFDAEATTAESRFIVAFKAPEQSAIEDINADVEGGIVRIVNTAGIIVFNGKLDDFKATAQAGVYIVVSAEKSYPIVVK